MAESVNLPAPFLGVEESVPVASIESPYCENLLNFNKTRAGIALRNGDSKYIRFGSANIQGLIFAKRAETAIFVICANFNTNRLNVVNALTGATDYIPAFAIAAIPICSSMLFNGVVFVFYVDTTATGQIITYNGAAWATTPYTSALFTLKLYAGNVYNSRAYLIQYGEAAYFFTGLKQIAGSLDPTASNDCGKIDLTDVISEGGYLVIIANITLADNVSVTSLQAFVFNTGEVLFYSGTYPQSATWALAGRARVSQPLDFNAGFKYQGDYLIFCDNGIVSLRDLFLKGSESASSLTINNKVQKTWSQLVVAARAQYGGPTGPLASPVLGKIAGVWDTKNNRLIISFPFYYLSPTTVTLGGFYFVFDTIEQSWSFHQAMANQVNGYSDMIVYNNKVLTVTNSTTGVMAYQKEGATGFTDRNADDNGEVTYPYTFLSAPIPFPKTAAYEATQIEPIMQSDLFAQTNWNFVADFGRQTTNNQQTDALTTSVSKPAVNMGMQNITYVQVKMSGTTVASKTVGLTLYSYNVWYNAGDTGSR